MPISMAPLYANGAGMSSAVDLHRAARSDHRMPAASMLCGMLLSALGLICYFFAQQLGAEKASVTALIPTFLGIPLMLLGYLSLAKPAMRKHFMHFAVMLSTLGL